MAYADNTARIEDNLNNASPTSSNGNVAYDLSRFDRRRIVREAVELERLEEQEMKKPVRAPMPKAKISYMTILSYIAVSAIAAVMLMSFVNLLELTDQTAKKKEELVVLQNENIRLNAEMEKRYSLGDIESYATNTLGMIKADRSQVEYIELDSPDTITMMSPADNDNKAHSISGLVKSLNAALANLK